MGQQLCKNSKAILSAAPGQKKFTTDVLINTMRKVLQFPSLDSLLSMHNKSFNLTYVEHLVSPSWDQTSNHNHGRHQRSCIFTALRCHLQESKRHVEPPCLNLGSVVTQCNSEVGSYLLQHSLQSTFEKHLFVAVFRSFLNATASANVQKSYCFSSKGVATALLFTNKPVHRNLTQRYTPRQNSIGSSWILLILL